MTTIHCMVDLETFGVRHDAAVISIGAVKFTLEGEPLPPPPQDVVDTGGATEAYFYTVIDPQTSIDAGGTVDASTIGWWMDPRLQDAAELTVYTPKRKDDGLYRGPQPKHIFDALTAWSRWAVTPTVVASKPTDVAPLNAERLWANGQDFDNVLLRTAFTRSKQGWPFQYNAGRDLRTVRDMLEVMDARVEFDIPPDMIKHHALWDAWWQARYIQAVAARFKGLVEDNMPEVKQGGRADALRAYMVSLRRQGFSLNEIGMRVRKANRDRCYPPLADAEMDSIIRDLLIRDLK